MRKILLVFIAVLGLTVSLYAQERTITGKVTDAKDGSTLPGVSVGIKGTSSGAITDIDGKYSITVPSDETVLVFTFVGYIQQEITVGAMSVVDLQLASDVKVLKDVVVTANAIEKEKRSLGYTVSEVKNSDLIKGSERSFINALQGQVPGAFIQSNSGAPGASSRVILRGGSSLNGNNQALIVVNGVPIDNSFFASDDILNNPTDPGNRGNDINPEDIESVTILKGPAAAALYGARASNGAILITTKSGKGAGKNKKMEISYSTSLTFESPLKLPELQNQFGQGHSTSNDGVGEHILNENWSWGPAFDGKMRPWGRVVEIDGVPQQRVKPFVALPNNLRDFFNTGTTFSNNLSLGGGNELSNYYLSVGDVTQKGIVPTSEFKRTSFMINGSTKLTNKVYSSSSINYVRTTNNALLSGQSDESSFNALIQTPRDISLLELKDLSNPFNTIDNFYNEYAINPWEALQNNRYNTKVDRIIGNIQLGYKPMEWLDVSYRLGTDFYTDGRRQYRAIRRPVGPNSTFNTQPGFYEESKYIVSELVGDLMVTAKKDFSDNFGVSVLLGHNFRKRNASNQISTASELVIPGLYNLDNVNGTPNTTNDIQLRSLHGLYADVQFSFKKYLFLGLTGRNDWSSTLPKTKNSFFYPSANISFVLTDAFNIQSKLFNYAKLRASIAQVGNDPNPYQLLTYFERTEVEDGFNNSLVRLPIGNVPGFAIGNRLANPDIKPEITQAIETGLDVNFFDDRLKVEFTYYNNVSKDQIIPLPLPPSSGYTSQLINAGAIRNKGVELGIKATPVRTRSGFMWDVSVTYTRNRNIVESLAPGVNQVNIGGIAACPLVAIVGQPYGSFFGISDLFDPEGRIIVRANGFPKRSSSAQVLGNIQPDFLAGISNTFTYKGLSFSFRLDTKWGGMLFSRTRDLMQFAGTDPLTTYNDRKAFVIPNSVKEDGSGGYIENTTKVNAETYWTDQNTLRGYNNSLIDASYIKLREVNLSYSFPKKWINATPFGSVQIGIVGRNLWLWTPEENTYVDPEMNTFGNGNVQGYDWTSYPSVRSIGGNIRMTF